MSERKRIAECFKIVTQRGKVIHLERVNPAGKPNSGVRGGIPGGHPGY